MAKELNYYLSLDYPVEIRHLSDSEGGGYMASIPCLGAGSFLGDGDSPEQAYKNLQKCKKEIFEELIAQDIEIPEPPSFDQACIAYSGKFTIRMPKELHCRLATAAAENNSSLNQYIIYKLSH